MTVLDAPALAKGPLSDAALRQLFVDARTYNDFQPTPVPDAL
jgi:hypothetical protein